MWLIDILNSILDWYYSRGAKDNVSHETVDEPMTINGNGLYAVYDTRTGVRMGNAMNSFMATYTLEQLGDNLRYEIRPFTL